MLTAKYCLSRMLVSQEEFTSPRRSVSQQSDEIEPSLRYALGNEFIIHTQDCGLVKYIGFTQNAVTMDILEGFIRSNLISFIHTA